MNVTTIYVLPSRYHNIMMKIMDYKTHIRILPQAKTKRQDKYENIKA